MKRAKKAKKAFSRPPSQVTMGLRINLADRLSKYKIANKFNNRELAERLKTSNQEVSRLLTARASLEKLVTECAKLGMRVRFSR